MNLCKCGCGMECKKTYVKGHNSKGETHPMYGKHHSDISKENIKKNLMGIEKYEEYIKEQSKINYCLCGCGQKVNFRTNYIYGHNLKCLPKEIRDFTNTVNIGRKCKEETKRKIGLANKGSNSPNFGKKFTTEEREKLKQIMNRPDVVVKRQKIAEKRKGYKPSPESIEKCRIASTGKKHTDESKRKLRESRLKNMNENGIFVSYNKKSIPFFDKLNQEYGLDGVYGKNEYQILGYSLDFYSNKYNLVIEWDEKKVHYKQGELKEKDKIRQRNIIEYLGCIFVRIKEWEIDKFDFQEFENILMRRYAEMQFSA